jgi:methylmalonyl-CoA decarboxylase
MPLILKKVEGPLGIITPNNPEKRNCLSAALIGEVCKTLNEFEASRVRVVILRAQPGVKVWSAGYDVNELPQSGRDPLPYAAPFGRLIRQVQRFPGPIIAMIEGVSGEARAISPLPTTYS